MTLPNNWKQVTVDQFIELSELRESDFGSLFLYNLEVLAILLDTDSEELDELEPGKLMEYISKLHWMRHEPSKKATKKLGGYTLKDLNKISLGEFIDLEHYFALDYKINLPSICSILYRKTLTDEWGNVTIEPYTYDLEERKEAINESSLVELYGVIPEYLAFRESIRTAYPNFFAPDITEDESEMDEEDLKAEKTESRWGWERIIFSLANEDVTKVDQVTDLPLIFVLNMLSMKTDLKI